MTRILRDNTGKTATGFSTSMKTDGKSSNPPTLSMLCAFQMHNVRLLLLSGIGVPYDPVSGEGIVGKNYAYQMLSQTAAYFSEDVEINPFIGAGAAGLRIIDEFNSDHFDHGPHGFHRRFIDLTPAPRADVRSSR